MREKATQEDIDRVMSLLSKAWKQYPHQRLGQVLLNLTRDHNGETNKHKLWNTDEQSLILKLEKLLKEGW